MKALPIPAVILALSFSFLAGCEKLTEFTGYTVQSVTGHGGNAVHGEHAEQGGNAEHAEHAEEGGESHHHAPHKIVVTSPWAKDVVLTQQYVCLIHSQRHIEVCRLEDGYLEEIPIKEGQTVKKGDLLFQIQPILYQTRLDAELANVRTAQLQIENARKLFKDRVVSQVDVSLHEAELAKAQAEAKRAEAELNFTRVTAPFDGIVDRLHEQQGSLVEEGTMLTTLSDNSVMWVYFNVPERNYLEYMAAQKRANQAVAAAAVRTKDAIGNFSHSDDDDDDDGDDDDSDDDDEGPVPVSYEQDEPGNTADSVAEQGVAEQGVAEQGEVSEVIELVLADGSTFPHTGKIGAIEANFNSETGNIPFRADFPNPERLLRHGQTGNVLIHRTVRDATVIPQRCVFEILAQRYVFVVDDQNVVHQRPIEVRNELEDLFVLKPFDEVKEIGVRVDEKIILEGARQVRDGEKVEYEYTTPEEVLGHLKYRAE